MLFDIGKHTHIHIFSRLAEMVTRRSSSIINILRKIEIPYTADTEYSLVTLQTMFSFTCRIRVRTTTVAHVALHMNTQ